MEGRIAVERGPAPRRRDQTKFWEIFDDPVLTGLELEATTNSPDLRAAFERVEQARAIARISRADLFPGLSFDPNGNRTRYSPAAPPTKLACFGLYRQPIRSCRWI
jgi:outer membrane protein TolC